MLKTIYGFLFTNQEQAKRPIPTINQIFSGIDVKNTPPSQSQLIDKPKESLVTDKDVPVPVPVPVPDSRLVVKSIDNIQEFTSNITEHIASQRHIHEENIRQKELANLEKPKRNIVQWIPDDGLAMAYNAAAEAVGKVPNLLKKIKQHQEKIASKQAAVDKIQNKEGDINPYDRFELIDYRQDILAEESKISEIELQLEHTQCYINNPIFEEFALYLVNAETYIKETELTGIINANDILTSQSIYIKTKTLMDQLKYGKKNQVLVEKLQFILQSFNMNEVHENSRGKNLREFSNFFIDDKTEDPLYLFDKMDIKAIGKSSTIVNGTVGGMVDNSLATELQVTEKYKIEDSPQYLHQKPSTEDLTN